MISNRFARFICSRSVLSGALLYVVMRWFDRLIGVASTIVLARLLTPDDFGVVALAFIALGLATVMLDLGVQIAVVQRPILDRNEIDTAWTLRLLQNALVASLLVASATSVARYYSDARLVTVLYVLGVGYLLEGFTGMGPVIFQKRQQYAREVVFFMSKRLGGFIVTMALALWFRNYWALVLGSVAASAIGVALSHGMYRVMPRVTLVKWRTLIGASGWLMLRSFGAYAGSQIDKLVIGRRDGSAQLGEYTIAEQIAAMPTSELLAPMSRALFPSLVAVQDDAELLRGAYLNALGIQSTLALPASVGLALVAHEAVLVLLGAKWLGAVPVMTAMALAYGAGALTYSGAYLLTALGKFRTQAIMQWVLGITLALLILVVFPMSDAVQIAWLRALLAAAGIIATAWLTVRYVPAISVSDMLRRSIRPIVATMAMSMVLLGWGEIAWSMPIELLLALKVALGAITYTLCLFAIWNLSGRPDGAEQWLLDRIRSMKRGA